MGAVDPRLIRAGRILLDMEQDEVAREAGFSVATLRRVEAGDAPEDTARRVVDALERAGVVFIEGGVRLRSAAEAADGGGDTSWMDEVLARADAIPDLDPSFTEASLYGDDGLPAA